VKKVIQKATNPLLKTHKKQHTVPDIIYYIIIHLNKRKELEVNETKQKIMNIILILKLKRKQVNRKNQTSSIKQKHKKMREESVEQ
jgi:hypothetical protein